MSQPDTRSAAFVEDELPVGPDDGIDTDVVTVIGGGFID